LYKKKQNVGGSSNDSATPDYTVQQSTWQQESEESGIRSVKGV
jgi:hypothetical protein